MLGRAAVHVGHAGYSPFISTLCCPAAGSSVDAVAAQLVPSVWCWQCLLKGQGGQGTLKLLVWHGARPSVEHAMLQLSMLT